MKAFVTGSTGLLGSNLVNALVAAGYQVKALARSREKAEQLFSHPQVEIVDGMRFSFQDWRDIYHGSNEHARKSLSGDR